MLNELTDKYKRHMVVSTECRHKKDKRRQEKKNHRKDMLTLPCMSNQSTVTNINPF
jgi:hypothetical protein